MFHLDDIDTDDYYCGAAYERMIDYGDYLRDEMQDRKIEEMLAAKQPPTWQDKQQQARDEAEDKLNLG